jgi:hypothetical protein
MIDDAIEKLSLLLQGQMPSKIDCEKLSDENEREFAELLNRLIVFTQEIHDYIVPLSQGKLQDLTIGSNNFLASPFKELHSRLLHLTWQAKQVAGGDYDQRVDFMGDFSAAFNAMVISLDQHEKLLKNKISELEHALWHIKRLEGVLPICANCKKIRREGTEPEKQENWIPIESYISDKSDVLFTHSMCPECIKKIYPYLTDK